MTTVPPFPASDPGEIPKFLRRRNAVKCLRCRVEVERDKIHDPSRCLDPECPLKPKESSDGRDD